MFCLSQPWERQFTTISPLRLCCEYEGFLLIEKVVAFQNRNTTGPDTRKNIFKESTFQVKRQLNAFSDQLVSIVVNILILPSTHYLLLITVILI